MIVIDATPLQTDHRYRGIGIYTAGLLDALTRLHHPVPLGLLMQPAHPDDLPLLADLVACPGVMKVPLHRRRWRPSRLQWVAELWGVRTAIRRARARVYHATAPNELVRVPGVATVATLYDLIPLHYPRVFFPRRRFDQRLGYGRYLRLLQCADRLIAISEATKRDAMDRLRIPSERISVTPLAVDEKRFYPRSAEEIDRAATRLGLRRPYFLHVGSPDPNKNAANILRAFDLFCRTGDSDHTLYILGKWSPQILIDAHSSDPDLVTTGRMRSLGYVSDDDLSAVYGGAEALVYPSQIEGFGLPVLEAMRCGVPVVTSHTSSLPEVSGDAALYVDPYSVEEIAEALRRLASQPDLRDLLRQRGLRQADSYSWERTARQTLRVYEEFL